MRFLDTNIFLRHLTRDDETKAEACLALFEKLEQGTQEVFTCEAIIAEVVYVLSSSRQYRLSHEEIRVRLRPLLALQGIQIANKRTYLLALDLYAMHHFLDFEDALGLAYMEREGITEVYSYDADFDRVPSVQRVEPSMF